VQRKAARLDQLVEPGLTVVQWCAAGSSHRVVSSS
jgi:hypothetical protein